jgi:purine nucleoside phosphorylase
MQGNTRADIAIIGGSGLYSLPITDSIMIRPETPWGYPSDSIVIGTLFEKRVAFLARHGTFIFFSS